MFLKNLVKMKYFLWKTFNNHTTLTNNVWHLIALFARVINQIAWFINTLVVPVVTSTSIFGFSILLTIILQLLSGFFLAWYYIPEPGLVVELREEMFEETKYGYEIFNLHVRGVDAIFILSYFQYYSS